MTQAINIAIDGVAGSGKWTTAKKLAERLALRYLDTGAMYRAIGLFFMRQDKNPEDFIPSWLDAINLSVDMDGNICLDGVSVMSDIRTSQVSLNASICASKPEIREYLQEKQKDLVASGWWVADGRDVGYAIMPDADVKFYMTASIEERARRRQKDYIEKGINKTLEEVKTMIEERDYRDMHRKHTPLCKLEDAIEIDTTSLTIDEQVDLMYEKVQEKIT